MTLYAMIVAATMVGMFDFCKMAKSGLEKRQIGKKRKEADERHATLFSFYCLPLRYILTPGVYQVSTSLSPRKFMSPSTMRTQNLAAPHGPKSVAFREFIAAAP